MSHLTLALLGEGDFLVDGQRQPAAAALLEGQLSLLSNIFPR